MAKLFLFYCIALHFIARWDEAKTNDIIIWLQYKKFSYKKLRDIQRQQNKTKTCTIQMQTHRQIGESYFEGNRFLFIILHFDDNDKAFFIYG